MEKKLQKIYLTYYISLIVQDLWQVNLSNFVNNLSEGIHRIKCKFGHNDEKDETYGIKCKYCNCFPEYTNDLIEYKWLCHKKSYQRRFDEKLKELFFNISKFSNIDNNKFIIFL